MQEENFSTVIATNHNAPIGVFDSGVGGISVLKHIRKALPDESVTYYADSHYAPYGNQSPEFIIERARYLTDFLISEGAKAIVVACNTATAAAVATLRQHYQLPIIGMEPAVKPAVAITKTGVIGVLATSGTLKSAQFAALLEHYGHHVQVVTQACHGLVEAIERGEIDAPSTITLLRNYLQPLLDANSDVIVLGCTHYPFVKTQIESIVAGKAALIDTGEAVARQLKKRLAEEGLLTSSNESSLTFWSNSQSPDAKQVIARLWQQPQSTWQLIADV
ncbi:glutamate racemase [Methyloradius palustris]|uniref:glutamate racemase n=1 Tax=Methyloradius palustris TaxID=2778876 RepID=UPI001C8BD2B4